MKFRTFVDGEECWVHVIDWEPFRPGRTSGPPEDCYPDEGGFGTWEICDQHGNPNFDLVTRLMPRDVERIDVEVFYFMERGVDRYEV